MCTYARIFNDDYDDKWLFYVSNTSLSLSLYRAATALPLPWYLCRISNGIEESVTKAVRINPLKVKSFRQNKEIIIHKCIAVESNYRTQTQTYN